MIAFWIILIMFIANDFYSFVYWEKIAEENYRKDIERFLKSRRRW